MFLRCENTERSFTGKERSYMNEWLNSLVWKATLSSRNQENEVCLVQHSVPFSVLFALFLHLPSLRDHTLKVLWLGHWVKTSYKLNVQRVPGIFWEEKKCRLRKVTNKRKSDNSESLVGRSLWSGAVPVALWLLVMPTYLFHLFLAILTSTIAEFKLHLF